MSETYDADNYCPLDDETAAVFSEIRQQIQTLNAQGQGVLRLYLRQHKLTGQWELAENGRELRRVALDRVPNLT